VHRRIEQRAHGVTGVRRRAVAVGVLPQDDTAQLSVKTLLVMAKVPE
jgi:hypothetical protein